MTSIKALLPAILLFFCGAFLCGAANGQTLAKVQPPANAQTPLNAPETDGALPAGGSFVTTSDGVRLFVQKGGGGKPVCIFIHGGPGAWSRSFEDMHGTEFETLFTMVYFDQRGCGRSDSAADYSPSRMAKDVDEIRASLHTDKVYLLAHSFGGIIAEQYAAAFPSHVSGLILMNSTLDVPNSIENQIGYINQLTGCHFSAAYPSNLLLTYLAARKMLDSLKLTYKLLSDVKASVDSVNAIDRTNPGNFDFARAAWGIPGYMKDFRPNTAQIHLPVLVITGSRDHSVGPDHYKGFHFPDQKICVIDGGHLLYYENTGAVLHAIRLFLDGIKS